MKYWNLIQTNSNRVTPLSVYYLCQYLCWSVCRPCCWSDPDPPAPPRRSGSVWPSSQCWCCRCTLTSALPEHTTQTKLKLAQFESVTLHLEDLQVLTYPRWWKGVLVVCVGDEFSPRRISRGTRFLSGEPGWCQLGGSVTDFTEEREREWTCWIKKKRDENKYHNLTCIKYPSYTCKKRKEKKNQKHNHRSEKHPLKQHASLTFMWIFWKWKVAVQHVHIWKSRCKRVINTVSVNELRDEVFRVQLEGLGCGSISTQWGRRMQQAERLPEAAVTALTVALTNESELSVTFTSGRETSA